MFNTLRVHCEDVGGKIAMELGPGDNIGLAYSFLKAGCSKVIAVEKYQHPGALGADGLAVLRELDGRIVAPGSVTVEDVVDAHGQVRPEALELRCALFEEQEGAAVVDLIYSNDALEHVASPKAVFRAAARLLKPGGLFVANIDLAGHNVFDDVNRPLDHLTVDERLWKLMFSHVETANCVRFSELLDAARAAGLEHCGGQVVLEADKSYLKGVRPHLLPRYRALLDDDLSVVQCVLKLRRPA